MALWPRGSNGPADRRAEHCGTAFGCDCARPHGYIEGRRIFRSPSCREDLGPLWPLAEEAVPALIEALVDEKLVMRKQAILALGKIGRGARAAIPALTALPDQGAFVRRIVKEALKRITESK